jgi:hypothetical protein
MTVYRGAFLSCHDFFVATPDDTATMAKGLMPDKPPVPARPRPARKPVAKAPAVAAPAAPAVAPVDAEARAVALESASRIRHLLAKGLAPRPRAGAKENDSPASSPSVLLTKFRALQTDLAERDKTVEALKDMLRRGGAPETAIDRHVAKHLFPGVDVSVIGATPVAASAATGTSSVELGTDARRGNPLGIVPGASRELMEREIRSLRARLASTSGVVTRMTSNRRAAGGGGDFAARDELSRVASLLERLGEDMDGGGDRGEGRLGGISAAKAKSAAESESSRGALDRSSGGAFREDGMEARLAARLDGQTALLRDWRDDESARLREELAEKAGEARSARDAAARAAANLRDAERATDALRVKHAEATAEARASADSARRASAAVAETLRETLEQLRGTLERQVAATRGVAGDVAAADEQRSIFRDDVLSRLDAHAAALEAAAAAEASRRAAAEAAHEADEATFATLCETAAASTRDAAERARDAADVIEAMASDVRFVRNEVESRSSELANESNDRNLTVREAREAASTAAATLKEVRLTQRRLLAAHAEARETSERTRADVAANARRFEEKELETRASLRDARAGLKAETEKNARLIQALDAAETKAEDAADARYAAELDAARAAEAARATRDAAMREIAESRADALRRLSEARAAYEAEIDKASAVEAARNSQPEQPKEAFEAFSGPNDPDFAFSQQKPTADAPAVRVALFFPGAEEEAEEAARARAAAEAARAAIVLAAKAEADAHARARAAAEADAREAARMLRERAADLAAARAEIHMLRATLRRRGDAGAGVPPGLEKDEDDAEDVLEDDAEDVLEEAAKTPRVMDEDREDAAKNVREERVVLREEKQTTEASEADEPPSSDATSSEDASAALLDASAAARARLETMLRGAEAYAAPER